MPQPNKGTHGKPHTSAPMMSKDGSKPDHADKVKTIRFGQQGVKGSPDGSKRNKAFKARHAKNIEKGKMSAAYWANKVKW